MDPQYHFTATEAERAQRRAERIAARKQRQRARRRALLLRTLPAAALAVLLLCALTLRPASTAPAEDPEDPPAPEEQVPPAGEPEPEAPPPPFSATTSAETVTLDETFSSGFAVLIDVEAQAILAQKNAFEAVSPASMTKILTVLVAAEQIESLDGAAPVTQEISDYCYRNGCSVAGFLPGEEVALEDLFYGAILPSGADASLALAEYVSGSEEAFVSLMNEKAEALGLSARFAGCTGLYDPDTRCSVYDMACILKAAMDNDLCRQVLAARIWQVPPAGERKTALELSNWFIRRIEDHMPQGFTIQGAKTGFVNEAGNCAASCAQGPDGRLYLCVTAQGAGIWPCIYDHVALYESVGAEIQERNP